MESVTLREPLAQPGLKHIGLIAGEGKFPFLVAQAARSQKIAVTAIGIRGITSPDLEAEVTAMHWVEFGQFNRLIELCHSAGIHQTVLAGRIQHQNIFQLGKIDFRGIRLLARMAGRNADAILGAITEELAREAIEVLDSTLLLRDCMPAAGLLTPECPASAEVAADIEFGRPLARSISDLDVGQTIVVKQKSVVAVEAMEGTNATILRAGEQAGAGCVVLKVGRANQERRFDVPVVGLTTVRKLVQARCAGLAIPGGEVLCFDQDEALALAAQHGITIFAW